MDNFHFRPGRFFNFCVIDKEGKSAKVRVRELSVPRAIAKLQKYLTDNGYDLENLRIRATSKYLSNAFSIE
jgi:hypothetical protein